MKELLVEFLQSILVEKSPSNIDVKPAEAKFAGRYGKWYRDKQLTQYVGRVAKGKWISAAGAEPSAGDGEKKAVDNLANQGELSRISPKINPFSSTQVLPSSEHTIISTETEFFSDGSFSVAGVKIEHDEDVTSFVNTRFSEWESKNSVATLDEKRSMIRQLTLVANAIRSRNNILKTLIEEKTPVGIIHPTTAGIKKHIDYVQTAIQKNCSSSSIAAAIGDKFKELRDVTEENEYKKILENIFALAESDTRLSSPGYLPAIAEQLSALYEVKSGRTVILPLTENHATVDVISLSPVPKELQGDNPSTESLLENVKTIYSGISVKRGEGGASSIIEKTSASVFEDHAQTVNTLRKLNTERDLFSSETFGARKQEIMDTIENPENLVVLRKYYGLSEDEVPDVAAFFELFKNGGVKCKKQPPPPTVVPRNKPLAPVNDKMSPENKEMYSTYFVMLAAFDGIYNSRVISQGFASHSWTDEGFKAADGFSVLAKQRRQVFKRVVRDSRDGFEFIRPDTSVSHNIIVDQTLLRTGNPCTK